MKQKFNPGGEEQGADRECSIGFNGQHKTWAPLHVSGSGPFSLHQSVTEHQTVAEHEGRGISAHDGQARAIEPVEHASHQHLLSSRQPPSYIPDESHRIGSSHTIEMSAPYQRQTGGSALLTPRIGGNDFCSDHYHQLEHWKNNDRPI